MQTISVMPCSKPCRGTLCELLNPMRPNRVRHFYKHNIKEAQLVSTDAEMKAIRTLTRLALPDDDTYLYRLGIALYGFASISSFMAEVSCHLDPDLSRSELEKQMGGKLLEMFNQSVKKASSQQPEVEMIGQSAAAIFKTLNAERSDIVHAYPITNLAKEQILHRRKDEQHKYFEVTNEFLDSFISRLHDVSLKLNEVRAIARHDLGD